MEAKGQVLHILDKKSGMGKKGEWVSQDFVIETQEQYPKKLCFNVFGENIEKFAINIGDIVTVSLNVESIEYNGRWFTNLKAWKCVKEYDAAPQQPESINPDEHSDLPF